MTSTDDPSTLRFLGATAFLRTGTSAIVKLLFVAFDGFEPLTVVAMTGAAIPSADALARRPIGPGFG